MILAINDLQVAPILPTTFRVNWPFDSGEMPNRFFRQLPWWPSWISDQNDFSHFLSTSCPDTSYQILSQLVQEKKRKIDFQVGIFFKMVTIFEQQVHWMLPTKFQVH